MSWLHRNWQDSIAVLAAIALGSLLLGLAAFGRSSSRAVPDDLHYAQSGQFSYSAAVPAGAAVYDGAEGATTGDPIFLRLSNSLSTSFTYHVAGDEGAPLVARGTASLAAELTTPNGWKRTVVLAEETSFEGTTLVMSGAVDLDWVRTQVASLEQQTGLRNQTYTLSIVPRVHTEGTLQGQAFATDFAPRLPFKLDEFDLHLPARTEADPDPLTPVLQSALKHGRSEPNPLPLLFMQMPVMAARWLAVLGFLASVGGMCLVAATLRGWLKLPADPVSNFEARYGMHTMKVRGLTRWPGLVIDVASDDDLRRIAESEGCLIMEESGPASRAFFVQVGETLFRFQAVGKPAPMRTRAA
jgi:hypothetical protein